MGINIQVFYFSSEEMKQFAKSKCGMVFFFFFFGWTVEVLKKVVQGHQVMVYGRGG